MRSSLSPIELLLLRVIDQIASLTSIYHLTRFFAKTDITLTVYKELNNLVQKELLSVDDPKAQVKMYSVTSEGKRLLSEEYSTDKIENFVIAIEPTGFILKILRTIDLRHEE